MYSVLAWNTCSLDRNWISPTSRIMCKTRRLHVASSTSAASSCAGERGGIMPRSEKRVSDRMKYGSYLAKYYQHNYKRQGSGHTLSTLFRWSPFPNKRRLVLMYGASPSLTSPLRSKYQIGSVRVLRTYGRSARRTL